MVNASPVIILARVGRLDLLSGLAVRVFVPEAVATEILSGSGDPARDAIHGGWGIRREVQVPAMVSEWGLGRGESAVIGLALELGARAVVDDRSARRCAAALGVPVIGTLGVIARAKRSGLVEAAGPVVRSVIEAGLFYDDASIDALLRGLGEDWRPS